MAVLMTSGGVRPNRFTPADYIKSSGTQYIDAGFKPNSNTRVVMDCDLISSAKYPTCFGAWNSTSGSNSFVYVYDTDTTGILFYGNKSANFSVSTYQGRHLVDANKNVLSIDGVTKATATANSFACSYNLYLFGFNSVGAVDNLTAMKLYSCQIYDNGTLVRDFAPCYDPDGVACLYDKVSKEYYYNAGSGEFEAG